MIYEIRISTNIRIANALTISKLVIISNLPVLYTLKYDINDAIRFINVI